jgi:methylmalonyl-CoA mutase N-terminal domain/subunit
VGPDVLERQLARLRRLRETRDQDAVKARLGTLGEVARGSGNTMPAIVEAVRAQATVGEISRTLAAAFGRHRSSSVI